MATGGGGGGGAEGGGDGGGGAGDDGGEEERRVHCSVCLEVFEDPRFLPCFHTFCLSCLDLLAQSHRLQKSFPCPDCRKEVEIPSEGVTSFQKNFYFTKEDLKGPLKSNNARTPSKLHRPDVGPISSPKSNVAIGQRAGSRPQPELSVGPTSAQHSFTLREQAKATDGQGASRGASNVAVNDLERNEEPMQPGQKAGGPAPAAWVQRQGIINTSFGYNGNHTRQFDNQASNSLSASVEASMARLSRSPRLQYSTGTKEMSVKLLLVGDTFVGKTALFHRYCYQNCSVRNYYVTIAAQRFTKVIEWSPELTIKLEVWDTPGYERFKEHGRVHYRRADGCLFIFDLTKVKTLQNVASWKDELDHYGSLADGSRFPCTCILVGNNKDKDVKVTEEQVSNFSNFHRFHAWRFISVKTNEGVDETFRILLEEVIRKKLEINDRAPIRLIGPHQSQPQGKCAF